jgi:hypothetical protein
MLIKNNRLLIKMQSYHMHIQVKMNKLKWYKQVIKYKE